MTAEELRALADQATPGPWYCNVNDLIGGHCVGTENRRPSESREGNNVTDIVWGEANAALIAALGPDAARLLADMADALGHFAPGEGLPGCSCVSCECNDLLARFAGLGAPQQEEV